MRKISVILISIVMVLNLAACNNSGKNSENGNPASGSPNKNTTTENTQESSKDNQAEASETTSAEASDSEAGKTLIVYYSATGNTRDVADYIASATDGDVFELEPKDSYSSDDLDWTDDDSRVVHEHDNPDERTVELVSATVPGWESYDTVFIGYPIWWGIAAWPVDGFIAANDFTGKTVIPFCTSSSSGLGESGKLLEEAAGTGNWLEGVRFSSRASKESVQEWVEGLGL